MRILLYSPALKTVTVRIPEEKVAKLDAAATHQQRDRSFVINAAVDEYLSLQEYHLALIDEGIRADEEGRVVPQSEVLKLIESWSRKARAKKKKIA